MNKGILGRPSNAQDIAKCRNCGKVIRQTIGGGWKHAWTGLTVCELEGPGKPTKATPKEPK